MGAIYLVRHGQASFGAADYDKLSEQGAQQGEIVGEELRRREVFFAAVRSGTMLRQRDTAIAAGFTPQEDPRWNEYDFQDILRAHPPAEQITAKSRNFQDLLDVALRGWISSGTDSEAGETFPAFTARIGAAFDELAASLGRGENALVFTSGGVIGALTARCLGPADGSPVELAHRLVELNRVTCNAGITKLVLGRARTSLVSFNEHSHFEGPNRSLLSYR